MKTYFTSKDWKELFETNREMFRNNLKCVKSSFAAFNANIDIITDLDKKFPIKLDDVSSSCRMPASIKSESDLKKALVNSLVTGKALELKIEDKELYNGLLKDLVFKEKRIGGQMGIVANTLAQLGVNEVIIFTNLLSEKLAPMFDKRVLFPLLQNNKLILRSARECGRPRDETRTNIIIEYKQDSRVRLKDKTVTVPRNNRFIISSPVLNSNPLVPKALIIKELFGRMNRLFLSGYHHVSENESGGIFREWAYQLKMIKLVNPKLLVHVEYVDVHKDWLNKLVIKFLKRADSLGLNESETASMLKYLGNNKLSKKVITSKYDAKELVEAGNYLMKQFGLKRLSIHSLEFVILLTSKDYPVSIERLLHANIYGIRVVNSKATAGTNFLNAMNTINENDFSERGVKMAGKSYKSPYNLIVVPNLSEKKVPVIYTVGLGDTISSAMFYAEEE